MTRMVAFMSMRRNQAEAYLQVFLDEMPASRARLAGLLHAGGANPAVAEDRTPASLDIVWSALRPGFAWAPGYTPAPLGAPAPPPDRAALGPAEGLPSWFPLDLHPSYANFSAATLWAVDAMGRHLGEVVIAQVPGTAWTVGRSAAKSHIHQNKPVVAGPGAELNPIWTVSTLVGHALRDCAPQGAPQSLGELYANWVTDRG
jgi:hypothetical protein